MNRLSHSSTTKEHKHYKKYGIKVVQTPCDLHLKLIMWRDAVYSYNTVPKVYLPDCLWLSWELIDSPYLLTVLLPSRTVGDWAFEEMVYMTDRLCSEKNDFSHLTCL